MKVNYVGDKDDVKFMRKEADMMTHVQYLDDCGGSQIKTGKIIAMKETIDQGNQMKNAEQISLGYKIMWTKEEKDGEKNRVKRMKKRR